MGLSLEPVAECWIAREGEEHTPETGYQTRDPYERVVVVVPIRPGVVEIRGFAGELHGARALIREIERQIGARVVWDHGARGRR